MDEPGCPRLDRIVWLRTVLFYQAIPGEGTPSTEDAAADGDEGIETGFYQVDGTKRGRPGIHWFCLKPVLQAMRIHQVYQAIPAGGMVMFRISGWDGRYI